MVKNIDPGDNGGKLWPLESGIWRAKADGAGFALTMTALGHNVSEVFARGDVHALLAGAQNSRLYPPEFNFCPATGEALQRLATTQSQTWVPPFGSAPLNARSGRVARGLRQTSFVLKLSEQVQRRSDGDADATIVLPPPGSYEFLSLRSGTVAAVLLALEPSKGALYVFLPDSQRWESLEHESNCLLAVSGIDRGDWLCEISSDGFASRIFLSTREGLACLIPDVLGLSFYVSYHGGAPAIGSPIQFGEQIWAPVSGTDGAIRFVSSSTRGEVGPIVPLDAPRSLVGLVHAPLADGRNVLWPCEGGQMLLKRKATGELEASFLLWPAGLQPAIQFGSPYLSRDGSLWLLCFDTNRGGYVYLQLGVELPEQEPASAPRLCSGTFNFRFATKFNSEPWIEPLQGDDGAADDIVIPLLESSSSASVLGIKIQTTAGLADVLGSAERMRAILVLDDDSNEIQFHTISVAEPWRLRFFVHGGTLWAYHPLLTRLHGWKLQV